MMDANEMLKVIRLSYPQAIPNSFIKEYPMGKPESIDSVIEKFRIEFPISDTNAIITPFKRLIIKGGRGHSYALGFFFEPFKLVEEEGTSTKYKDNPVFHLEAITKSNIIEELSPDIKRIPKKIKKLWNKKIRDYQKKLKLKE